MSDEAEAESGSSIRKPCTMPARTMRYLEKLVRAGTHGTSVPGVMTFLIMQGVQDAIAKGIIDRELDE